MPKSRKEILAEYFKDPIARELKHWQTVRGKYLRKKTMDKLIECEKRIRELMIERERRRVAMMERKIKELTPHIEGDVKILP